MCVCVSSWRMHYASHPTFLTEVFPINCFLMVQSIWPVYSVINPQWAICVLDNNNSINGCAPNCTTALYPGFLFSIMLFSHTPKECVPEPMRLIFYLWEAWRVRRWEFRESLGRGLQGGDKERLWNKRWLLSRVPWSNKMSIDRVSNLSTATPQLFDLENFYFF